MRVPRAEDRVIATQPSLIALDWGTSSLRAYLLGPDGSATVDSRTEPWGIMQIPDGDFAGAFDTVTKAWRERWPALASIACGMIGSNQGWVGAPYCPCPAGAPELAATLVKAPDAPLHVIAGVAQFGDHPDMMRGEETEIVGALALHPEFAAESLLVLPGTHSKWVRVLNGKVSSFATYMTGEVFHLLREHSILGRQSGAGRRALESAESDEAFTRGVLAARGSSDGVAALLFSARALVLAQRLEAAAGPDYLSGLLIGDELRCGLMAGVNPSALVGDAGLCRRYVAALRLFGLDDTPVINGPAARGLWQIAWRAGLTIANSTD